MTTLAFSNIAWSFANRLEVYDVLKSHGFTGLEIAPGLFFSGEDDPFVPSEGGARERLREIEAAGLTLVSMQSLLFGVEGAELFGPAEAAERLTHGLTRAIELAGRFGIPNLVFGSPRQRVIPPGLAHEEVIARARSVLLPLADLAAARGTVLAMEPNPPEYGTNFMANFPDALAMVKALDHPAITLNFDVGALHMTNAFDAVGAYIAEAGPLISHLHFSAPFLGPAPASPDEAAAILRSLAAIGYGRSVSVEMKAVTPNEIEAVALAADRLSKGAGLSEQIP